MGLGFRVEGYLRPGSHRMACLRGPRVPGPAIITRAIISIIIISTIIIIIISSNIVISRESIEVRESTRVVLGDIPPKRGGAVIS